MHYSIPFFVFGTLSFVRIEMFRGFSFRYQLSIVGEAVIIQTLLVLAFYYLIHKFLFTFRGNFFIPERI